VKTIHVAAAVITDGGRIFATQRGYGPYKDYWEFPGGKLEAGETARDAVIREIREELDTLIEVKEHLMTVEYDYPEFHLIMDCFIATVREGSLTLTEHESARWLRADELHTVNWLPADTEVVARLAGRRGDSIPPCGTPRSPCPGERKGDTSPLREPPGSFACRGVAPPGRRSCKVRNR